MLSDHDLVLVDRIDQRGPLTWLLV
jgi:hypothetical protein